MTHLCKRLNNLSVYLQGALQNRTEEGDEDNIPWLKDGVAALWSAQSLLCEWADWWDFDNPPVEDEGRRLDALIKRTKEAAGMPERGASDLWRDRGLPAG